MRTTFSKEFDSPTYDLPKGLLGCIFLDPLKKNSGLWSRLILSALAGTSGLMVPSVSSLEYTRIKENQKIHHFFQCPIGLVYFFQYSCDCFLNIQIFQIISRSNRESNISSTFLNLEL